MAVVLAASWMASVASAAHGSAREVTPPPGCIEVGSRGQQIWHAPATDSAATALGDALQELANAHRDTVAGVAMCSDYAGAAIFVSNPAPSLLSSIQALGAKFPSAALQVRSVAAGLDAQLAASRRVTSLVDSTTTLSGVSPDMYTGGLRVTVQAGSWPVGDALRQRVTDAATSDGAVAMPVEFTAGSQGQDLTTRAADTQPCDAGGVVKGRSSDPAYYCTQLSGVRAWNSGATLG